MATGLKKNEKIDKKAEKAATVADLTARLKASSTAVLADYRGMTDRITSRALTAISRTCGE